MGSLCNESFEDFLNHLKQAGIAISNEAELRERLAEAQRWRYAFTTLARNGSQIGIKFADLSDGCNIDAVRRTLAEFQFPESAQAAIAASLKTSH